MADRRRISVDYKPPSVSKPNFGKASNPLEMLIARDIMKRQSEEREPALAAQREEAVTQAKMQKPREILMGNMKRMKTLSDQVPAGKPGFNRFSVGAKSSMAGFMQTMPQLNSYNRFKDVILGSVVQTIGSETSSRLSDQDINRMKNAFPNLPYDSEDQKALSWNVFLDTVNDVAQTYGATPIAKEEFFNENDANILSRIPGSSYYQQDQGGLGIEQERQQAIQAIQSGKDAKKIASIFRSRTGQELNG